MNHCMNRDSRNSIPKFTSASRGMDSCVRCDRNERIDIFTEFFTNHNQPYFFGKSTYQSSKKLWWSVVSERLKKTESQTKWPRGSSSSGSQSVSRCRRLPRAAAATTVGFPRGHRRVTRPGICHVSSPYCRVQDGISRPFYQISLLLLTQLIFTFSER